VNVTLERSAQRRPERIAVASPDLGETQQIAFDIVEMGRPPHGRVGHRVLLLDWTLAGSLDDRVFFFSERVGVCIALFERARSRTLESANRVGKLAATER